MHFQHQQKLILLICAIFGYLPVSAQKTPTDLQTRFQQMSQRSEAKGLAESFKGITADGTVVPDLFKIRSTGITTEPVRMAAANFLQSLTQEQRKKTIYPINDPEWRKWMNQHFYIRQGVGFDEMSEDQRQAAFELLRTSLSAKGLQLTRDIMRLNHTLGELNNNNFIEYGEWLYWITIMGEPSANEPWGWQIDGHHVIINYFVLGDQVVMTPLFVGSEPVVAESGKYEGTSILQKEQAEGLNMLLALDKKQQEKAIIEWVKEGNNNLTEAFKDNVILDYAGIKGSALNSNQRDKLVDLVELFIENMDEEHSRIRMDEIKEHLEDTYFGWIGGMDDQSAYYYRIHSPVLLIEFDHQALVGIRHLHPDHKGPHRQHIHVVVRTPNGNDYGKDLLRQHYLQQSHGK